MVENQTKFDLEYVTHNYRSGWPQDDVKKSFVLKEDYDYVLPPGAVGTQLWRFHQGGNFYKTWGAILTLGAIGNHAIKSYFSVRIRDAIQLLAHDLDLIYKLISTNE